jgi:cytoskeletal protein RodZ
VTAESGQSGNRLFIILSVALIGLICIGLMGLGGVFYVVQSNRAQEMAALMPEATATPFPPTFTPTSSPTFTPTNTPEPTSTSTPVIRTPTPGNDDVSGQAEATETDGTTSATATNTPVVSATAGQADGAAADTTPTPAVVPSSGGVLPTTSSGAIAGMSGLVLLLLVVSGVIYRHRASIES